ncbi:unnamed protein product, partial [Phaeothamnion confervicola]
YSPPVLSEVLETASVGASKLDVGGAFGGLCRHPLFLEQFWQQRPYLSTSPLPQLAGCFTIKDVEEAVEHEFMEAGRGTISSSSGWRMAKVSQPRGKSFEDAKLRFEANVFVLQTQGRKRWRVFAPPPPSAKPDADPLARGKGKDALLLSELGPPLIDAILSPGHLLYVPAGWPHTTDTMFDAYASTSGDVDAAAPPPPPPSVHLTVGVESHIFALDYASLRALALRRLGGGGGGKFGGPTWLQKDLMRLTVLEEKAYWGMLEALPVGFLGENAMAGHRRWSDMREA